MTAGTFRFTHPAGVSHGGLNIIRTLLQRIDRESGFALHGGAPLVGRHWLAARGA